jgi:uncharacterized protein YbaR (Trm112 family)
MTLPSQLLDILVCPKCKGPLEYRADESVLVCHQDKLKFPIRDGIPIMLIDEAMPLDEHGTAA